MFVQNFMAIQQLLRHFSLDQSNGTTDGQTLVYIELLPWIKTLCLFSCDTSSSLCSFEVMLGHRKAVSWNKNKNKPTKKASAVWKFKPFQMVFKTRCSRAASGWHIRLHMRGKLKPKKIIHLNPSTQNLGLKCQSSKNKAKHAFCHYCLYSIMNRERGGQGQQRTVRSVS